MFPGFGLLTNHFVLRLLAASVTPTIDESKAGRLTFSISVTVTESMLEDWTLELNFRRQVYRLKVCYNIMKENLFSTSMVIFCNQKLKLAFKGP